MVETIARVLVDSPLPQLDRLLDYRVPALLTGIVPGVRVTVPLRVAGRVAPAYVVEVGPRGEYPGPLSDVVDVISEVPVLRPEVWALARAVADRAAGSAADVLRLAIPTRQVRVEKAWLARGDDGPAPQIIAPSISGYASGRIETALTERRRVALRVDSGVTRLPSGGWVSRWALTLAEMAAFTVAAGESAILIAPDYRDQAQLATALAAVLPPESIVQLDGRQPNPDRYRGLLRAIGPHPLAIVGNRSVGYAPAARLGLIAIWNDGDPLLGEPLAPYVHARDAALVRQEQQRSALVFAAHTRSTETERLVELGWLEEIAPHRPRRPRVIPTSDEPGEHRLAAEARIPAIAWREARSALERGPVLVQVARPGYAPGLRCSDCSAPARCRQCSGPLRQRRSGATATCTWCGAPDPAWRCDRCSGSRLTAVGTGSVRTADELGRAFPGTRVIVSDGERPVLDIDDRPALVIATRGAEPQPHGGYRAVLLLDGERMLARESLRVGEDCLRWWSDAAALAADDAPVILVGVRGGVALALAGWNQPGYARSELRGRRELRFPPAVRMATLRGLTDAVAAAVAALPPSAEVIGSTEADDVVRSLIRFDYAHGAEVADAVRAEIVRQATSRRKPVPGAPRRGRQPLPLRARFDDPEPFEE
jgi:primosomal protein N' (replication factor Y)